MSSQSKRVLVCPLDWGLGHATRSTVVIRALLAKGHEVEIASSGRALDFLKIEFPTLSVHELPGYNVRYSSKNSVVVPLAISSVRIAQTIKKERDLTEKLVVSRSIDAVISDNRYGCHSSRVPSALITHQLHPKLPGGLAFMGLLFNRFISGSIKAFDYCWIPDEEGNVFSGELSKSNTIPFRFIGILSRMTNISHEKREGILAIVSGPEPQREIFEKMLTGPLETSGLRYQLVRGLPRDEKNATTSVHDHLSTAMLNAAMGRAALVIARSGYSTIMDLAVTGGRAHFVPTPGQTEQEYLAMRLHEKGIAGYQQQQAFNLSEAISMSEKYSGFQPVSPSAHLLSKEIDIFLRNE